MRQQKNARETARELARELRRHRKTIRAMDVCLLELVAARMKESLETGAIKMTRGDAVSCPEVERKKLQEIARVARRLRLSVTFARKLMKGIFAESRRLQAAQRKGKLRRSHK